ncbi:hypothetical protein AYO41_03260 [Verrucomicrobia bacterium SCGC AG-212-E04]|nr:hypothetical protein AYO41_03260 [Verrucomicrobia bacterium SCGC AG-212-E04]
MICPRFLGRLAVAALGAGLMGCAMTAPRSASSGPPATPEFWARLAAAEVIYIGERHTEAGDHDYEFEIIKGLKARGIPFAIGWEMFDVSQQPLLDAWQSGSTDLATLLRQTEWAKHWGKYSPTYERMLRWSRGAGVENYALNAPGSLSRKIAQGQPLTPEEKLLLPRGFRPLPGGLSHFKSQMGSHPGSGPINYERYYRAQTLWDQTMADRVVQFRGRNPGRKLVVFAGRGHVEDGFGIPPYVKQKLPALRQEILLPGTAPVNARPASGL